MSKFFLTPQSVFPSFSKCGLFLLLEQLSLLERRLVFQDHKIFRHVGIVEPDREGRCEEVLLLVR